MLIHIIVASCPPGGLGYVTPHYFYKPALHKPSSRSAGLSFYIIRTSQPFSLLSLVVKGYLTSVPFTTLPLLLLGCLTPHYLYK